MDSATSPSTALATSPSSLPDSAIFGDIDKLSPITAVKTSLAITGFPGLSSPIVFASPNLNPSAGSYSKSFQFPQLSPEEICQHDSGGKNIEYNSEYITKNKSASSNSLIHCTQREHDVGPREDQFSTPSGCFDKYLVDNVEIEYGNTKASYDLTPTRFKSVDNVGNDSEEKVVTFPDMLQLEEHDFQENPPFNEKHVETNANIEGNELHSCSKVQDPEPEHKDISDGASEFLSQSTNTVIRYQDGSDATGEVHCENYENEVLPVIKGQRSSGLQRRRLQFGESDIPSSWSPSNAATNRSSPCAVELEVFEQTVSERTAISGSSHTANFDQPVSMISFTRHSNSRSTVSKPSGIGLHLNSIISSKPKCASTGVSITSNDKGFLDVQGEMMVASSGYYPQESTNNGSISLKIGERFSTTSQNQEATDSYCPEFVSSSDPSFRDNQATLCGKRKFTLEQACVFEESSQSSPQKKSKKALANSEDYGCKRCNCKKTKCLKLYCDCFAAGIYCSGTCSCQGCFNRPDYVDTVLEVRQQIESRNPLAFAPKIVERLIDSHVESNRNDEINSTPASARHKRGCNCKKSMCMKKYCECYQNNVGCSSGCRCEGCQNVYGKKEDYHGDRDAYGVPVLEARDENVDLVPNQDCFLQNEPSNHHSITPITPSFQLLKRYLSTPESDLSKTPNCQGSLGNSNNHRLQVKSKKKDFISSYPEFNNGVDGKVNVFSPTDDLADIDNSSMVEKPRDELSFENGDLLSFSSHDRCSSSFTNPIGQISRTKLFKAGFEKNLDHVLEDNTPEILMDPINCVKVSSPNKKRVSPPRICGLRQLGSSFSSAGLKSGRKFILRALPSFPPLTPCIDGKDNGIQSKKK